MGQELNLLVSLTFDVKRLVVGLSPRGLGFDFPDSPCVIFLVDELSVRVLHFQLSV